MDGERARSYLDNLDTFLTDWTFFFIELIAERRIFNNSAKADPFVRILAVKEGVCAAQ